MGAKGIDLYCRQFVLPGKPGWAVAGLCGVHQTSDEDSGSLRVGLHRETQRGGAGRSRGSQKDGRNQPARRKPAHWHARLHVQDETTPKTISGLLRQAGEAGTHSIIGIRGVNQQPGHGVAWPLSRQQLLAEFGTERSTRQQVEHSALGFAKEPGRWQAVSFPVYSQGEPVEYAFIGCSGD